MKVNFSELILKDLDGNEGNVCKDLGNLIYKLATDVNLVPIAMSIAAGKEVDISPSELKAIKLLVDHKQQDGSCTLFAFVRKALHDFIDPLLVVPTES